MIGNVDIWTEISRARLKAHAKHGAESIEALAADDPRWLSVLVEEVGEVAHELTYDSTGSLRGELIDVLAVASAWVDALDSLRELQSTRANSTGGMMGANDAREMLEAAQAECVRLERENKRLADALAAVPASTEAGWRKAIADQVRRNCTPSTEAYKAGGDPLIYAVCDWIENPPAWASFTAPVPEGGE